MSSSTDLSDLTDIMGSTDDETVLLAVETSMTTDVDRVERNPGSVLIIILQCETRACDKNILQLRALFSDPYFSVQVCYIDEPEEVLANKSLSYCQYVENYRMIKALSYARDGPYSHSSGQKWWSDTPCAIIKDSSVSNLSAHNMKKRIMMALRKAKDADLFFLCKWNDVCDGYTDVDEDECPSLKWSLHPSSTQAIMYTPKSRDLIIDELDKSNTPLGDLLNKYIAEKSLLATVFVPNIVDFDIDLATSIDDYVKLNECAAVSNVATADNTTATVWLIIMILLVAVVAWVLITA